MVFLLYKIMSTLLGTFNYQPKVLETIGRWKDYLWVDVGILKNHELRNLFFKQDLDVKLEVPAQMESMKKEASCEVVNLLDGPCLMKSGCSQR